MQEVNTTPHVLFQVAANRFRWPTILVFVALIGDFLIGLCYRLFVLNPYLASMEGSDEGLAGFFESILGPVGASPWWSFANQVTYLVALVGFVMFFRAYVLLGKEGHEKVKKIASFGMVSVGAVVLVDVSGFVFSLPGIPPQVRQGFYSLFEEIHLVRELGYLGFFIALFLVLHRHKLLLVKKSAVKLQWLWVAYGVLVAFKLGWSILILLELPDIFHKVLYYVEIGTHGVMLLLVLSLIRSVFHRLEQDREILQAEKRASLDVKHREVFGRDLPPEA